MENRAKINAVGMEFKVNVSTNKANAMSNSTSTAPNVLYFPKDDPNSIIFNGNIYDLNRLITTPEILAANADLNTYIGTDKDGVYISPGTNTITNKPAGVTAFGLLVFNDSNNDNCYQVLFNESKIYTRRGNSGDEPVWTDWETPIYNASEVVSEVLKSVDTEVLNKLNLSITKDTSEATEDIATLSIFGKTAKIPSLSAFNKVKVNSTTFNADSTHKTLEFAAGNGVTITPDATNRKVTIGASFDVDSLIGSISLDGTAIKYIDKTKETVDLNELVTPGFYVIKGSKASNKPTTIGIGGFILLVLEEEPSMYTQVVWYHGSQYNRHGEGGTHWGEWVNWNEVAKTDSLGCIKIGYSENNKNYAVKLDENNKAYVTVPWVDTKPTEVSTKGTAIDPINKLNSSFDLNSFVTSGFYFLNGSKVTNAPTNTGIYILLVINTNNNLICQIAWGNDTQYIRVGGVDLGEYDWNQWINLNAVATEYIPGNIKIGYTTDAAKGNYAVQLDDYQKAFVNVPSAQVVGALNSTGLVKNGSSVTSASGYTPCPIINGIPYYKEGGGSGSSTAPTYNIVSTSQNGLVSKDSSLVTLASTAKAASNNGKLAVADTSGMIELKSTTDLKLAEINKANTWTQYQDFTAGAGNSGSDMRFKKEVQNIDNILDKINSLDVIKYIWEHPDEKEAHNTFGINADELLELGGIFATMVHSRNDKYDTKWVEYDRFGVLAIKAIQELSKELEYCKNRIAELESKL